MSTYRDSHLHMKIAAVAVVQEHHIDWVGEHLSNLRREHHQVRRLEQLRVWMQAGVERKEVVSFAV